MFGIAAATFITRKGELTTAGIDDDWLLLGRMAHKYFNIVVAEAGVAIDEKCVIG